MKFDLILTNKLGYDVYIMANGAVYFKYAGNTQHIGQQLQQLLNYVTT